jgi:hypothetical protein
MIFSMIAQGFGNYMEVDNLGIVIAVMFVASILMDGFNQIIKERK